MINLVELRDTYDESMTTTCTKEAEELANASVRALRPLIRNHHVVGAPTTMDKGLLLLLATANAGPTQSPSPNNIEIISMSDVCYLNTQTET